jgi:dual specificity tyrosine-phosphorylation-regulated kinase 2/3/4
LEEQELFEYPDIYYLRTREVSDKSADPIKPGHFQFVTNEHIAFRFQMQKVLGKGAFGGVLQCVDHKYGQAVAIKLLRDHAKHHDQIMTERDFLNRLQADDREHVIELRETFSYHGFFCFVMELGHRDLYQLHKAQQFSPFHPKVVQVVARDTAAALQFVHERGIIHCDVKPENILFMGGDLQHVKLIDFGCSATAGDQIYTYIQSRFYRAPEIVIGIEYGPGIDVWSLGCVMCEMVTGQPLFEAEDETELMQMYIRVLGMPPKWMRESGQRAEYYFRKDGSPIVVPNSEGRVHQPGASSIAEDTGIKDEGLLDLVSACLAWDPKERISTQGILDHPWLQKKMRSPRRVREPR